MAKIETNEKNILHGGILLEDYLQEDINNSESILLLKEDCIYKLIDKSLRKRRQKEIEYVYKNRYYLPTDMKDLYYEKRRLIAYSMPFYEEYDTLNKVIHSDISLLERKKISLDLIELYKKLLEYKLVYFDWHSKNVMYHEALKLLDIDSVQKTSSIAFDCKSRTYLLQLILSVLVGIDLDFDLDLNQEESKELFLHLVSEFDCDLIYYDPLSFLEIEKMIKEYTMMKVEDRREIILKCS